MDGSQEVSRSPGVSITDKHIETHLRTVAPGNRVRGMKEGDSAFVSGELVWKDDLEKAVEEIRAQNAASLEESYDFLKDYRIVDVAGAAASENGGQDFSPFGKGTLEAIF